MINCVLCQQETNLVQDQLVKDSGQRDYRTDWSAPWPPWSHPSPQILGYENWKRGKDRKSRINPNSATHRRELSLYRPLPVWSRLPGSSHVAPASLWLFHKPFLCLGCALCNCLHPEMRKPSALIISYHSSLKTQQDSTGSCRRPRSRWE